MFKSKTWVDTVAYIRNIYIGNIVTAYTVCWQLVVVLGCLSASKLVNLGWVVDARILVTNTI